MFRHLFNFLLVTASFAGSLSAATETGGLSVRALLLVPGGPVVNLFPMAEDTVGSPVMIGARGLSEAFKPGGREFSLVVPDTKKESGFRGVAKIVLPAEGKEFIILLEPAKDGFKVHVVNGRESRFGADSVLFFNASEASIVAVLGSEKTLIKPRQVVFAKAPSRGEKPYYQATLYQSDNGKVRPFFNSRWPHRDNVRCYAFIYRNLVNGRLTYQAVDEDLRPVASAPTSANP